MSAIENKELARGGIMTANLAQDGLQKCMRVFFFFFSNIKLQIIPDHDQHRDRCPLSDGEGWTYSFLLFFAPLYVYPIPRSSAMQFNGRA